MIQRDQPSDAARQRVSELDRTTHSDLRETVFALARMYDDLAAEHLACAMRRPMPEIRTPLVMTSVCNGSCGPLMPGLDVCRQHAEAEQAMLDFQLHRLDDKVRWFQTRSHQLATAIYVQDHPITTVPEGQSGRVARQQRNDQSAVTDEIAKLRAELAKLKGETVDDATM